MKPYNSDSKRSRAQHGDARSVRRKTGKHRARQQKKRNLYAEVKEGLDALKKS